MKKIEGHLGLKNTIFIWVVKIFVKKKFNATLRQKKWMKNFALLGGCDPWCRASIYQISSIYDNFFMWFFLKNQKTPKSKNVAFLF